MKRVVVWGVRRKKENEESYLINKSEEEKIVSTILECCFSQVNMMLLPN